MKYLFLIFICLFYSTLLTGADGTWNGGAGADNNWITQGNWVGGIIGGFGANAGDDVTLASNSPSIVDVDVVLGTLTNQSNSFYMYAIGTNRLTLNEIYTPNNRLYIYGDGNQALTTTSETLNVNLLNTGSLYLYGITIPEGSEKNITVNANSLEGLLEVSNSNLRIPTLTLNTATYGPTSYPNTVYPTNIVMNSGRILFAGAVTFTSNISGTGTLLIASTVLSGNNSFTGTITDLGGNTTLTGTTNSIPSTANIANINTLIFDQTFSGSYSNVISGTGSFEKRGTGGILTLSGANTYTGTTTISAGALSITGAIANGSTTGVASGATLEGSGSVGPVNNSGTVNAGLAAGDTFTVNGVFTQSTADARVKALITPNVTSLLSVTGAANLDGTLELSVGAGVYPAGTSYNVLNATGGINNEFTTLDGNQLNTWTITYNGNLVNVSPLNGSALTPFPLSSLPKNPQNVGRYFFGNASVFEASQDLTNVANACASITNEEDFAESLLRLSPVTQDSNVQTTFQNDLQIAVAIDNQFQTTTKQQRLEKQQDDSTHTLCYGIPKTGVFIQPIGIFYNQRLTADTLASSRNVPFTAYTYGAGFGYEHVFDNQFVIEGGVGYTHSNLDWKNNFGNSKWSSLYLAPFFGWFNDTAFANIMVMGAFNFYNTDRQIQFAGVDRVAKSRYNSYDILIRSNGGARFHLTHCFLKGSLWLQPEGTLNYLTIFTEGYTETGAVGINLQVKEHTNFFLQPSFRLRFIEEFITPEFCFTPNIYVGWLANILLGQATTTARFTEAPTNIFFNIQGDTQTTNQLVLGAEFFARRFNKFELTSNFEADILSKFEIYTVKVKFEWLF